MRGKFCSQLVGLWVLVLGLAGCQPALNWREIPSEHSALRVMLPCKPDRAVREVPLGGQPVMLDMMGCDAAGAMFAVSHARLPDPMQAGAVLAGWQAAVLSTLQATEVTQAPFSVAGAMGLPQSVRVSARGQRADGSRVWAQAVWFARVDGNAVDVYHAVVLMGAENDASAVNAAKGDKGGRADGDLSRGVANTFFEGLRLP